MKKPTYILGLDPGTAESSGVVLLDDSSGIRLTNKWIDYNPATALKLTHVDSDFAVVIERIGHYGTGMPAGKEVFETCFWTGRFIQIAREAGARVFWLSRPTIKAHLCGVAKAKDANVRQALLDRFGVQGTKKDPGFLYEVKSHMWSALAVAVTALDLWGALEEVE